MSTAQLGPEAAALLQSTAAQRQRSSSAGDRLGLQDTRAATTFTVRTTSSLGGHLTYSRVSEAQGDVSMKAQLSRTSETKLVMSQRYKQKSGLCLHRPT